MPERTYRRDKFGITIRVNLRREMARHGHRPSTWDTLMRVASRHAYRLGRKGYVYDGGLRIAESPPISVLLKGKPDWDRRTYLVSFYVLIPVVDPVPYALPASTP